MKKFIYYIGFLALCLLPASCSLEEESSTEVEKDKYMNDAKEAQDVLLGVYRSTVEDAMIFWNVFLSKWNRIMKRTKNWLLFILPKPEL